MVHLKALYVFTFGLKYLCNSNSNYTYNYKYLQLEQISINRD